MSVKKILYYPHPVLETPCEPITEFDNDLSSLITDLKDTLVSSIGVAISAPQIGISKQVAIISGFTPDILVMVNPKIISHSNDKQTFEEGCLSFPGIFQNVKSWKTIVVEFYDETGAYHEMPATDVLAVTIQHEIEHLEGSVFIKRINAMNRLLLKSALSNLPKNEE